MQPLDRALCRILANETLAEIMDLATPRQKVAIALRVLDYNDQEIARMLGITRSAVGIRIAGIRQRIETRRPELAAKIEGRTWEHTGGAVKRLPRPEGEDTWHD